MVLERNVLIWYILTIIILYILQGVITGFGASIPIYLRFYKASWQEQGTYSWVSYPFSFKILWAPIIDSVYSRRFGRNQTWLIPIQLLIGSQDIVVDGWSVALFTTLNPQLSSTCQTVGVTIGGFIGSIILLTLESSNFTNTYIREPLSLPRRSYGLFSLEQFTLFWGIIFIVIGVIMTIILIFKQQSNKINNLHIEEKKHTKFKIFETYLNVLQLFKKRCMQQLILILITGTVSYGATYSMTNLTLLEYGVKRETLGLLRIPLVVVDILVPLCLNRIRSPLGWFARGYILRLISSVILAIYIFFTPRILHTSYFYPILIILLCLNEAFIYIMVSSGIGFYARISDPRIAGTYMTLLVSVGNLGLKLSSTLALYIANWLPKTHAYSIEVGACFILGCIWIKMAWNILKHLDALPVEEWYLTPSKPIHCYLEQEEEE
ncbi:unnamed protein product [Rotaria sordida]|uniref:Uncharacterized protein n=1 Tax=Rotaria sordida TaxID=392033 RepID=A0A819NKM3_9BILA|nr:unnamed protein product [Rotaria sordida]